MADPVALYPLARTPLRGLTRRAIAIPGYALAWLLALGLAPVALPLLALADRRSGRHTARARLWLASVVFLSYELVGLAAAFGLWLAALFVRGLRGARWQSAHRALQAWWANGLFRAASRILRLELEVEGAHACAPGPLLVLVRHASLADTLLPAVVVAPRGIALRYVLKRELLWDPCLDVVGQRLPNAFIQRGTGESQSELAQIAALGRGLGAGDGVLIYPEGTRFSAARRARGLERIAASGRPELLARAQALRGVLPPRTAGVLALLDAAPDADVLVLAHTGLEGLATLPDLLRLGASPRRIRVRLWRVPRAAIPLERDARVRWLYAEWARVDAFVAGSAP